MSVVFILATWFTALASQDVVTSTSAELDISDQLMAEFRTHVDGMHEHLPGERGVCLTSLVQKLRLSWGELSPDERAEITEVLAPGRTDLFAPFEQVPSPPAPATDTCWGTTKANRYDSEHFSIQWDNGTLTDTEARNFAESLEESWDIEIGELGWRRPNGSNSYLMLIQVENMGGGGAGAYTSTQSCGGSQLPYVVASASSFDSGSWYKTMACHELHHAIQFGYGYAHEFWWWEAAATWMEDLVYPFANDWASALYMYAQTPQIGMNAWKGNSNDQDLFWHTYGMGIWGMYLDQHVGGNELVRATWEASQGEWCSYCVWMPDVIEELGYDFDELMMGYMAHTAMMDYRDRSSITDAKRADTVRSLPDEGSPSSSMRPQSLGINIVEFEAGAGGTGKDLEVIFEGSGSADRWLVVLTSGSTSVEQMLEFDLEDGQSGKGRIPFEGDEPAYLVVSPVYSRAQGTDYSWRSADTFDYSWSAQLVDGSGGGGSGDGSGGDGDGDGGSGSGAGGDADGGSGPYLAPRAYDSDDDKGGCTTAPARWNGWMVGLIGMVIGWRRRSV